MTLPDNLVNDIVAAADVAGLKFDQTTVRDNTITFYLNGDVVKEHRVVHLGSYTDAR